MSQYNHKDHFHQKAKKEGYVARSAFKLLELNKKFRIIQKNSKIVDLGCSPGGWLQVVDSGSQIVDGKIIGIDLQPLQISLSPHAQFIQGDFLDVNNQQKIVEILGEKADWVLSDMSPHLTGIKFKDLAASLELCEVAIEFSKRILSNNGGLVMKIFPGPEFGELKKKLKKLFGRVVDFIPDSTRKTSNEVYLVALKFKG